MKLRQKSFIISGIAFFLLFALLYSLAQVIILSDYRALEERLAKKDIQRAVNAIKGNIEFIDTMTIDWSAWDDTYEFVQDNNEEYIESNLVAATFLSLNLNAIIILNNDWEVVYGHGADFEKETIIEPPEGLIDILIQNRSKLTHENVKSSYSGILMLPGGPMLMSSRPIITSDGEGPVRGSLIMGRFLSDEEMEKISDSTGLVLIYGIIGQRLSADFLRAWDILGTGKRVSIDKVDSKSMKIYTTLEDIFGNPAFVLQCSLSRDVYLQGVSSFRYFTASMIVVGFVLSVIMWILLQKFVISKLASLSEGLSSIISSGDHSARVNVEGDDELSSITKDINNMLNSLQESGEKFNRAIVDSLNEKEVLLKEVHHRVKNNMAVISSLLALQSGYIDDKKYLHMFNESQSRIRSMALVHEKLYQSENFTHIDVADYVQSLVDNVKVMFAGNVPVESSVKVSSIELDIDTLVPCGLIINELLTNVLKHAFEGKSNPEVKVEMTNADDNNIVLTISDNGLGLPAGFDIRKSTGLGLKLINVLVSQIEGELKAQSENGVTFTITFPKDIDHAESLT